MPLVVTESGEGVFVEPVRRKSDARLPARRQIIAEALWLSYSERGLSLREIAVGANVSHEWIRRGILRAKARRERAQAEAEGSTVPMFGVRAWELRSEIHPDPYDPDGPCGICGDAIREGSSFVCAKCMTSGRDRKLAMELERTDPDLKGDLDCPDRRVEPKKVKAE